jgi:hypothetical protein
MGSVADVGVLPLVGLAVLAVTFATASLQSRNHLPFTIPEGAYVGVSVGAVSLVGQFLVSSVMGTAVIVLMGGLAWAAGYGTGQIEPE